MLHNSTIRYVTIWYIVFWYFIIDLYNVRLCFVTLASVPLCYVTKRYVNLHNASNYFSLWNLTYGTVISFVTLCLATHFTLHNLLLRYADSRYVSYPIISGSFSLQFNGLFFKPTFQKSWFIPYLCCFILWTSRHQLIIGWNCDRVNALQ